MVLMDSCRWRSRGGLEKILVFEDMDLGQEQDDPVFQIWIVRLLLRRNAHSNSLPKGDHLEMVRVLGFFDLGENRMGSPMLPAISYRG
jgi:hypothetical protein